MITIIIIIIIIIMIIIIMIIIITINFYVAIVSHIVTGGRLRQRYILLSQVSSLMTDR